MKHLFIINPKAGKGKAVKYENLIRGYFKDKEDKYEIKYTEYEGHAIDIVKNYDYEEICKVYSIGGDGTLNEVLNGLVGKNALLGIIPAGSGNDFVRSYINNKNIDNILYKTIEGNAKDVDIGFINDRYFMNVSSVGFDANVALNARLYRNNAFISGEMSYIFGAVRTLFKYKSQKIKFIIDGKEHTDKMFLLAAANGRYYGGGKAIAPEAEIVDGLFDVYGIRKSNPFKIIRYFKALLTQEDLKKIKETYYFKCKSLKIISEKDIITNIDGEFIENKEFNFEIIPKGIKLIIPNEN